ncbi:MAG TPA: DUF3006 domain-containing protein [Oscillospiraceae bacterium]|nr:DUF3006 domain-containing protein [Oscillospiraceae bacterium]
MKAVIDRFEGEYAVVLFGNKEIQVDVPKEMLPAKAQEGSWLNVSFELDANATEKQAEKIQSLLEKLKNKHK